ncbi:MAG: PIN domain-containing protein [Anaerolineae bacterium]|nr:PIN domain-containing protein [Anaerolineae bacterium]
MRVYLDSSVVLVYLYGEFSEEERFPPTQSLFAAISSRKVEGAVSFYLFPELYGYVAEKWPADDVSEVVRLGLVQLLSLPLLVKPFLERERLSLWQHRLQLLDISDVGHAGMALEANCDAIITYDYHFGKLVERIPVWTPEECLAVLEQAERENERD